MGTSESGSCNSASEMSVTSQPIILPDDFVAYPATSFSLPTYYKEDIESVLIPEGLINDRVKGLAREIFQQYAKPEKADPLVIVCVLKSSFKFFCALQRELETLNAEENQPAITAPSSSCTGNGNATGSITKARSLPLLCEFIRVKSYVNTTSDTATDVQIQGLTNPVEAFTDKHVLIVEDIIDTGRTMGALLQHLRQYNSKSTRVVSLLRKRLLHDHAKTPFSPHFCGFDIPDRFVIGYGMDYNERYRDLNHLCIINKIGIKKYAA